jgi:hypothetical protein
MLENRQSGRRSHSPPEFVELMKEVFDYQVCASVESDFLSNIEMPTALS